ncbi:MAG: hypothetical protein P8H59_06870 [Flavobacteriales bacterium]|nr:hypothetical protein [Flavobacteriales bacterium]
MKNFVLLVCTFLLSSALFAQSEKNYTLLINGEEIEIGLDQEASITIDGKAYPVLLNQKEILTFDNEYVSFNYPREVSVSVTTIAEGIDQVAVINANGGGFIVQIYPSINPTALEGLMLNEVIKESLNYGYTKKEAAFSKKLQSGQVLSGTTATLDYRGDQQVYTVASYGAKDQGIIVLSMITAQDFAESDQQLIDLFLNSLEYKEIK